MSSLRPILILSIASLATAGCNLAPHYARPAMEVPDRFKEATGPGGVVWSEAQPRDVFSRGSWWEIYGDADLDGLEKQVAISNETIRAAEANFRVAQTEVAAARAAWFPVISTAPSFTRSRASSTVENSQGVLPSTRSAGGVNEYALPFNASYEIDLWQRVRNGTTAATASAEASAADLQTALLSTQADLARDYFELRAVDAERRIVDETVASYRQSLDQIRTLYQSGIDSEEDVARAETQLNTAVAQATDLGVARAEYEHAIAALIGRAPANFALPAKPFTAHPPGVPPMLPSELLLRRPDIAAAERRAAAANAEIGIARAAWFPRITLGASAGWESSDASRWLEWPSRFWSVGPQLATALFTGGARRAQTEQARALFDAAAANYRGTVVAAFQSVEDNLAATRVLAEEAEQQRVAVNSSQHLLDLANTRFQLGIDSYLNVITAQTALLSNRETEVQIQLRRMLASIELVRALGGGWKTDRSAGAALNASAAPIARSP